MKNPKSIMKKLTLIIFTFFVFSFNGFSQGCLPEGIIFTTQQQIDDFQTNYPGCTEIEGDVFIGDTIPSNSIINLDGLNLLNSINGDLIIRNNQSLTIIEGLDNLSSINGSLIIVYNFNLTSIISFMNIYSLVDLKIQNNYYFTWFTVFRKFT